MATFQDAQHLKFLCQNVNMGGSSPVIVSGPDNEEVISDQGLQEYGIEWRDNVLNVDLTLQTLNNYRTNEQKLKYLAGLGRISSYEIEEKLSEMNKMAQVRYDLFKQWFEKGRPDTYIFR